LLGHRAEVTVDKTARNSDKVYQFVL